jgi:phosphate transport system substrate-binding protein
MRQPRRRLGIVGCFLAMVLYGCTASPPPSTTASSGSASPLIEANDVITPTTKVEVPFTSITAGRSDEARSLTGIGGTVSKPLYDRWFDVYSSRIGVKVDYQGKGSGAGIRAISLGKVDFAGAGAPMTDAQMRKAKGGKILHIPTAFGAIVLAYNVPGISARLRFSASTLARIYLGDIRRWDDAELVADNPSLASIHQDIIVLHRADSSGATYGLSDYLSETNPDWQRRVGKGASLYWQIGLGVQKNDGMVRTIKHNPFSIGYTELNYAIPNKLDCGLIKNRAGHFVEPTLSSIAEAISTSSKSGLSDLRFSVVNAPGPAAYPLCTATWLLVYQNMTDAPKALALARFLWWATHDGQAVNRSLNFAPVPPEITARSEELIRQIRANGKLVFEAHSTP